MKDQLRAAGQWIVDRLDEPSTWAGLAGVVASMAFIPHAQFVSGEVVAVGGGVMAVIAIVKKEKSK